MVLSSSYLLLHFFFFISFSFRRGSRKHSGRVPIAKRSFDAKIHQSHGGKKQSPREFGKDGNSRKRTGTRKKSNAARKQVHETQDQIVGRAIVQSTTKHPRRSLQCEEINTTTHQWWWDSFGVYSNGHHPHHRGIAHGHNTHRRRSKQRGKHFHG